MKISRIITHPGFFHADELLAIAVAETLQLKGHAVVIERKNGEQISEEDFADPSVMILDVGQRFQPELMNFDHHQDESLPATCSLILAYYKDLPPNDETTQISEYVYQWLADTFFKRVSDIDCGIVKVKDRPDHLDFSAIIRSYNNFYHDANRSFYAALGEARTIFQVQLMACMRAENDLLRWKMLPKTNGVAYCETTNIPMGWKAQAKLEGIWLMVSPSERGGYQVVSRDTNDLIIPEHETQKFRHKSGFLASYDDFQTAMAHAQLIVSELPIVKYARVRYIGNDPNILEYMGEDRTAIVSWVSSRGSKNVGIQIGDEVDLFTPLSDVRRI